MGAVAHVWQAKQLPDKRFAGKRGLLVAAFDRRCTGDAVEHLVKDLRPCAPATLLEKMQQLEQQIGAAFERHAHGNGAQQYGALPKGFDQKAGVTERRAKVVKQGHHGAAGLEHRGGEQQLLLHAVLRLELLI